MLKDLRRYFYLALLVLTLTFVLFAAMNAQSISSIDIKIIEPSTEYRDKSVLGFGKKEVLPDYRVKLRTTSNRWIELGIKPNRSAVEWLTFPVKDNLPLRNAQEIQLFDADKLEDDLLDRVQIGSEVTSSQHYQYRLHTEYRFETGLQWFFGTALGKAIAAGITLAIIIVVVSNL